MVKRKKDSLVVIPSDYDVWECDHCGTVERAIKVWDREIHFSCPCICHVAKRHHLRET